MKFNLQQPYYQSMAYGPSIPPIGNRIPQGFVTNDYRIGEQRALLSASRVTHTASEGERSEGVREQVARTLREFGFEPKGHTRSYRKPYPDFLTLCHIPEVLESRTL
jgi:hypothetical protein